jgi:hypothetical protein
MKKHILLFTVPLIVFFCTGCMNTTPYKYIPNEKISAETATLPLVVSITVLEDLRDSDNTDYTLVGWIPLVPYGKGHFSRPETTFKYSFKGLKPREDFAKAIYAEIKQNNLFQTVLVIPQNIPPKAGLVITGTIKKARMDTTITFYGISFLGRALWVIGLPIGKVYNGLDIHFEMRRLSDGAVVWEHDIKGDWNTIIGAYYGSYQDEPYTGINKILRQGLHDGILKMSEDIKNKPIEYWK